MCNSLQKAKHYNPACHWTKSSIQCQILCPTLFNNQWLNICNIYATLGYGIHSIKFKPLHIMFYRELIMFCISQLLWCVTILHFTKLDKKQCGREHILINVASFFQFVRLMTSAYRNTYCSNVEIILTDFIFSKVKGTHKSNVYQCLKTGAAITQEKPSRLK